VSARELLARTPLVTDAGPYALAAWAPGTPPPEAAVFACRDDRETTALVAESALAHLPPPAHVERGFALLTLDLPMDWGVIGVLAEVTAAMAAAGVPVGAVSAYSRDHLLVPAPRLAEAIEALAPLTRGVADP
jgi:hypothetical protein